ncbi:tetraacyldisaccharide 4'-kinase [bacterium HD9-500m-PIT-SAG08]|nr:tetraacyldisaccharide 4'-kinase [bacterium HD9-500m-PIT-SAG08]
MILKKPKFWDFKKPNFFAYLLYPFTIFVKINNIISSLIPKKKFTEIKTLCVGNLYVGGTGKTPTSLLLYNLLKKMNINPVTAKKFYNNQMDEQKLLKDNSNFISLTDRKKIVKKAIDMKFDMIIFDDGLQEKWIDYDIKFACFDGEKWIGNGHLIPSGPLREKIDTIKNYHGIFLKTVNEDTNLDYIFNKIRNINPNIEIFETIIEIKNINQFNINKNYIIFSGIGNPDSFKKLLLKNQFKIIEEIIFPDHYNYQDKDISEIINKANSNNSEIITTEKDFNRIPQKFKEKISFLEINIKIKDETRLIQFLKTKINEIN